MNSPVVLSNDLFAVLDCQSTSNAMAPASPTTGEAHKLFADTPPLAELRRQSKADRARSSDDALECDCGHQQTKLHESPPPEEPPRSETPAAAQESAENVVAEGEAATSVPGQSPGTTATAADGSAAQTASQSLPGKEDSVSAAGSAPPGVPVPTAEEPSDAPRTPTLPDGAAGNGKAPGQTGVSVATTMPPGPNAAATDVTAVTAEYRTAGVLNADGHAGEEKTGGATTLTPEKTQTDQMLPGQQQPGANPNGSLPDTVANARSESAGSQSASHVQEIVAAGPANAEPLLETRGEGVMQPEPLAPVQTDNTPDSGSFSAQSSLSSLAEATLERGPVGTLGAQILDYVHASLARGDRQLLIRLDPPELGSVTMRFQEQRGLIEGVLEVSKDQTRWELEEALPQALRSLQEAGIQIRRLDVMVSDQSEKEPQREQCGQDGSTEHRGSDQREPSPEHMAAGPWSRWTLKQDHNAMGQEPGTAPQMDVAHNRINMLA